MTNYLFFIIKTARDLLSRLLIRDPKLRLGSGERDAAELKEHPFFKEVNWDKMMARKVMPPWSPQVAGSLDTSQFDSEFTSMMPTVSPDVRDAYFGSLDRAFEGFSYVDEGAAHHIFAQRSSFGGLDGHGSYGGMGHSSGSIGGFSSVSSGGGAAINGGVGGNGLGGGGGGGLAGMLQRGAGAPATPSVAPGNASNGASKNAFHFKKY
jgi:hypothetical protein